MVTVVIPTYNQITYTDQLLNNILQNEVLPKKIILIDDCGSESCWPLVKKYKRRKKMPIEYIRHSSNKGVNYSWNEGIKLTTTPIVSILNNDIIISKFFFKKLIESYNRDSNWGIVCPKTIKVLKNVNLNIDDPVILKKMGKREGWAWSARMSFIKKIDPIPDFLRTYCGDDYVFYCAKGLGYSILKMMNNTIYHYGGKTVSVTKKCAGERKKEKKLFAAYKPKIVF